MGKLADAVKRELKGEIKRVQKEVRHVLVNAVGVAQEINRERIDTGFMVNNWYASTLLPIGPAAKNESGVGGFENIANRSLANLAPWRFGSNAYIVNNTEYASYHDLGTIYITPLFLSFQVQTYVEKEINKIK